MPTYGQRPDDVVQDTRGNALRGVVVKFFSTRSLALADNDSVGDATTDARGRWEFDTDALDLWARIPDGTVWRVAESDADTAAAAQAAAASAAAAQAAATLIADALPDKLDISAAAATYETQVHATATFETQAHATATFETKANVTSGLAAKLDTTVAAATYLTPAAGDIRYVQESESETRVTGQAPLALLHAVLASSIRQPVRLAFLGSSSTAGNNATVASQRYVNRLTAAVQRAYPSGLEGYEAPTVALGTAPSTLPGVQGLNGGIPSTFASTYTPGGTITSLGTAQPHVVFHMIGSNDYQLGVAPATYQSALAAAVASVDAALTIPPLHVLVHSYRRADVVSPTYPWTDYRDAMAAVAAAHGKAVFIDVSAQAETVLMPSTDSYDLLDTDQVHQTDAGHLFMANRIAAGLRLSPPAPIPYTVKDTFGRVDGSLGTTETGQTWTVHTGVAAIASKRAGFTTAGTATFEASLADVDVSASVLAGSGSRGGVVFRAIDDANRWYASLEPTAGNVELWATQTGGTANVATVASGIVAGGVYTLRVVAVGSAIRVYVNGASRITATNTLFQTATRVGIRSSPIGCTIANLSARPA